MIKKYIAALFFYSLMGKVNFSGELVKFIAQLFSSVHKMQTL